MSDKSELLEKNYDIIMTFMEVDMNMSYKSETVAVSQICSILHTNTIQCVPHSNHYSRYYCMQKNRPS